MQLTILHVIVSTLLFFILFFGIGFILNMLLRMTWVMAFIYPIVVVFVVDEVPFISYFKQPGESFNALGKEFASLQAADIVILLSGLAGAIVSGFVMKALRKRGYRMF